MALIDYLSKSSLFQGLPEHYLNSLAPYLRETFYKRDEYLFREGDMANDLHFITSGQVVLEMRLSNPLRRYQGDIALTSLSAPHPVAFRALIPPHRYELAARAVLDTVCVSLDCTELMPRMDSEPELGNIIRGNLIQLLSRRLMQTREVLAYERASNNLTILLRVAARPFDTSFRHWCYHGMVTGGRRCGMTSEMPSEQKVQWIEGDLLAAVVDDQGQADEAMNALELQGILRDSIRVFHGEVGRYEIEKIGGEGLKGMTLRLIEDWVANAKDLTDRLKDESAGGHYVLIMPLPNPNMEDQVRSILQAHGAHSMAVRINDNWKSYA